MFKRHLRAIGEVALYGFNLLSEILFVQALPSMGVIRASVSFQSLERDSVCSSRLPGRGQDVGIEVSIS